jgi:chromate transporter
MPSDSPAGAHAVPPLSELFLAFAWMSLHGFGGVLPWARRVLIEEKRWMTAEEFNEAFALCQFLPGPNIVNFSIVYGSRLHGPAGALVAFVGLVGPPVAIVIGLGALYAQYGEVDALRRILAGLAAAAAGLIIGTVAKMAEPLVRGKLGPAPFIVVVVFVAVVVMKWPLLWVLLGLAPASIAVAWWWMRR